MEKINIFVVSHKPVDVSKYPGRKIVYVGNNHHCKSDGKTIFVDNTGDNISKLNPYYCELTALYWVWKNYPKCEYIGFEHYSRNFWHCFKKAKPKWLLKKVQKYDFFQPKPFIPGISNAAFWKKHEGKYLYDILKNSVKRICPDYFDDWNKVMNSGKMTYFNMFVCSWKLFDEYMKFVMPILDDTFKNISRLPKWQQSRSVGYMAERLFDVFIKHNNLSKKTGFVYIKK